MTDEDTKEFDNARPLLERILARLDAMDSRLSILESKSYDTRPMWEQFIKEMHEGFVNVKEEMHEGFAKLSTQIKIMNEELLEVKTAQRLLDGRVTDLERKPS